MAHRAITDVTRLSSGQARTRLRPPADALASRPASEAKDLARLARRVATARMWPPVASRPVVSASVPLVLLSLGHLGYEVRCTIARNTYCRIPPLR